MSDSEDSTVTYTEISSPYEDLSDIGSPGAEGPIFQDPPSPDYVPGPEEPEQAPPSPIYVPFVPEPVYPEFLPVDDEVFPAEEQPMPAADSPTHQSPGYIPESDPEEDPEEDDEEDPEEDPADYPADRGDDRDDEEPSDDDDDDDDDAEEEEHLAPADPAAVAYSADQDPYLAYRVTARMSIRPQAPAPFLSEEVAERLLALPTPPPSPLSPYSSPLPQIPSPPLPIPSPPPNSPTYVEGSLGSRAAGIRQRDALPSPVHETEMPEIVFTRFVGPATTRVDLYRFADMLDAALGRQKRLRVRLWDRPFHRRTALLMEEEPELRSEGSGSPRSLELQATARGDRHDRSSETAWTPKDPAEARSNQRRPVAVFRLKMAPRGRPTRLNPDATPTPVTDTHTTTSVTSAQLQAMIDGVHCLFFASTGTKRVVDLTQWFERMETVFRISNCTVENQVKFATCTLMGIALTWWNSHVRTVTNDVAYAMTWTDLKKKMTTKYCPRNEIKKIEAEMWNLKVKGTDVVAYNQRFAETGIAVWDRYVPLKRTAKMKGMSVAARPYILKCLCNPKPKTMQEAIEMATELMIGELTLLLRDRQKTRGSLKTLPEITKTNNRTKGRTQAGLMLQGTVTRNRMKGLNLYVPSVTHITVPWYTNSNNCKNLATLAKTVGSRPATGKITTTTAITITTTTATTITTTTATTTTREPKGQIPMPSFALSVGL
ncbi:putative reverse transcriptase domain-containing protein [Tanacetum coccineum]